MTHTNLQIYFFLILEVRVEIRRFGEFFFDKKNRG